VPTAYHLLRRIFSSHSYNPLSRFCPYLFQYRTASNKTLLRNTHTGTRLNEKTGLDTLAYPSVISQSPTPRRQGNTLVPSSSSASQPAAYTLANEDPWQLDCGGDVCALRLSFSFSSFLTSDNMFAYAWWSDGEIETVIKPPSGCRALWCRPPVSMVHPRRFRSLNRFLMSDLTLI